MKYFIIFTIAVIAIYWSMILYVKQDCESKGGYYAINANLCLSRNIIVK